MAWTAKLYDPAVVGVPASVPLDCTGPMPGGKLPAVWTKVYGAVPPVAVNTAL